MADNNYQYSSDNTLLALITLIKNALRGKANTGDVPTKVSQLTNDSKFQTETQVGTTVTNAVKDKADKSEIPTKTSQLTNDSKFQTDTQVTTAINNAIKDITGIKFEVVTSLPATGVNGTIYLVAHSHGEKDIYDEYIYVNSKWEKIGSTDIDLSGYVLKSDMHEITSEEVTTIWNGITA